MASHNGRPTDAALLLHGVEAGYGNRPVLNGIDLRLNRGEILAVIGHNGAGKSSLAKAVLGTMPHCTGRIELLGEGIAGYSPAERVAAGLAFIPQSRAIFPNMSVVENLTVAGESIARGSEVDSRIADAMRVFPPLSTLRNQRAGTLSGGERRMLVLGMALMLDPQVLMLDEPSIGLAPVLVDQVMEHIVDLRSERGLTVLLIEQNVTAAASIADRVLVLRLGSVLQIEEGDTFRNRTEYSDLL